MLATNSQGYAAVNLHYYEQNINWSQSTKGSRSLGSGNSREVGRTSELYSFSARISEFRLEIKLQGAEEHKNQAAVASQLAQKLADHGIDLDKFSHQGRSLLELTPTEAQALVSPDGHWGIAKTSERLAQFVLKGAGDNLEMLRAGREGIIRGFKEAEKIWGGELPEISHQTLAKALGLIDERLGQLGGSIIDLNA